MCVIYKYRFSSMSTVSLKYLNLNLSMQMEMQMRKWAKLKLELYGLRRFVVYSLPSRFHVRISGFVAQSGRAFDSRSKGCRFESCRGHTFSFLSKTQHSARHPRSCRHAAAVPSKTLSTAIANLQNILSLNRARAPDQAPPNPEIQIGSTWT